MKKDPSLKVNNQKYNAKKFLDLVRERKDIHKYELMRAIDISESTYEKLKPYMEYWYGDKIFYEKSTKMWSWELDRDGTGVKAT